MDKDFNKVYEELLGGSVLQEDTKNVILDRLAEAICSFFPEDLYSINEVFEEGNLKKHFEKHCIAGDPEKVKHKEYPEDIFYNYDNIEQYQKRVSIVDKIIPGDKRVDSFDFLDNNVPGGLDGIIRKIDNISSKIKNGGCVIFYNVPGGSRNPGLSTVKINAFIPPEEVKPSPKSGAVDFAVYISGKQVNKTLFPVAFINLQKVIERALKFNIY